MSSTLEVLNITGTNAVEIGKGAAASGAGAIAVGATQGDPDAGDVLNGAFATGALAQAFGAGAKATAAGAVQIGAGTNATTDSLQFQATRIATVASVNALISHLTSALLQQGALAISATAEEFKTVAITIANVDGFQVSAAVDATIPFTAAHVVTALKFGAILVQMSTAGAITTKVVSATQAYDTLLEAVAALPDADASNIAIGYITINADAGGWTAITDNLTDGSGLTAATFEDAALATLPTVV